MKCSICKRAVRKDNRRGAHARCLVAKGERSNVTPLGEARRRFAAVARALSLDPDQVQIEILNTWVSEHTK